MQESVRADQVIPVLVLSEKELEAGPEKLWDTLQYYVQNDDVCVDDFTGILVVTPTPGSDSHGDVDQWAASDLSNFSSVYHMTPDTRMLEQKHELPSGPYFLSGPNLHQAWRLYPDNLDAFTFGLLPDDVYSPQRQATFHLNIQGHITDIEQLPSRDLAVVRWRVEDHPRPQPPLPSSRLRKTVCRCPYGSHRLFRHRGCEDNFVKPSVGRAVP